MPRQYPNKNPAGGVFLSLVGLIGTFFLTERMITTIEDKVVFLNILIQVSSVMVGFTSLISVFLIQSSLQDGRDVASRYLLLVLEARKLKYGSRETRTGANNSADATFVKKLKNLMGSYKREQDRHRRLLEAEKWLMIEFVVVFVGAIATSLFIGMGRWELIWLPLGLTMFGFLYFPLMAIIFIHLSSPQKAREEFSLRVEELRSE